MTLQCISSVVRTLHCHCRDHEFDSRMHCKNTTMQPTTAWRKIKINQLLNLRTIHLPIKQLAIQTAKLAVIDTANVKSRLMSQLTLTVTLVVKLALMFVLQLFIANLRRKAVINGFISISFNRKDTAFLLIVRLKALL